MWLYTVYHHYSKYLNCSHLIAAICKLRYTQIDWLIHNTPWNPAGHLSNPATFVGGIMKVQPTTTVYMYIYINMYCMAWSHAGMADIERFHTRYMKIRQWNKTFNKLLLLLLLLLLDTYHLPPRPCVSSWIVYTWNQHKLLITTVVYQDTIETAMILLFS